MNTKLKESGSCHWWGKGGGYDPLFLEARHFAEGAPHFERSRFLEVLGLDVYVGPGDLRQRVGVEQWCFVDQGLNNRPGRLYVFKDHHTHTMCMKSGLNQ